MHRRRVWLARVVVGTPQGLKPGPEVLAGQKSFDASLVIVADHRAHHSCFLQCLHQIVESGGGDGPVLTPLAMQAIGGRKYDFA